MTWSVWYHVWSKRRIDGNLMKKENQTTKTNDYRKLSLDFKTSTNNTVMY